VICYLLKIEELYYSVHHILIFRDVSFRLNLKSMKKIVLIALLIFPGIFTQAQIGGILNKTRNKIENEAAKKVDSEIRNKSADKNAGTSEDKSNAVQEPGAGQSGQSSVAADQVSIKAYSKYDFVPGEKIIGFEDFTTGNIGDFPAGWNTNASAEIVTIEGKPGRWLMVTRPGVFIPEFTDKYPDDFTVEFDLLHGIPITSASFHFVMAELLNTDNLQSWNTSPNTFKLGLNLTNSGQKEGTVSTEIRKNSITQSSNQVYTELMSDKYNPVHIAIWRQKERVRVYVNQDKFWDIPKAIAPDARLNAIFYSILAADANIQHYIGNLRLAVGAPDTRNKMLTQNKWVTHGILFDVNSDNIKPESYGTLKEMANVMKENADLKVKIIGHTDGDGKDDDNLDLSKRRAASVKEALGKEFSIENSRMETDGKGESEPIDVNDNPAGKANNRRVEFIKL
jgi:OOP family OmpA-OmpF porin